MDPIRLGLAFRALRRRRGWSQDELACRAKISRATIQRIERGEAERVTGATIRAIAEALGARFEQRLLWHGEALDRLLDADHARLVERVVRWLRSEGWEVTPEATFAVYGERGSIDVLAFDPESGALLVIEVKTAIPDMQGLLGTLDRKTRLAPSIALERGWRTTAVGRLLVLTEDSTIRRRVAQHAGTLDAALPGRTRAARRWVRSPVGPFAGIMFLPSGAHQEGSPRPSGTSRVAVRA